MRHPILLPLLVSGSFALSGCMNNPNEQASRAIDSVTLIDQTNMNEIMLTVADPEDAVRYFAAANEEFPDRIALRRGLAQSLVRAGRQTEAVPVWQSVIDHPEGNNDDRVQLADAYIRNNQWDQAELALNTIPPTHETFQRYRLEAMVADGKRQWERADSFYEIAAGLTTRPASIFNNWGYSKLTRGDNRGAERLFVQALQYDPNLFTAKNNLVLARAAQRNYQLPLVEMTQVERAQLLHTMAIAAVRQDDVTIGRGLLQEAIDTHPQHFEQAVRALRALESNVSTG
jgi:Flp pilus assembly protein TadD